MFLSLTIATIFIIIGVATGQIIQFIGILIFSTLFTKWTLEILFNKPKPPVKKGKFLDSEKCYRLVECDVFKE